MFLEFLYNVLLFIGAFYLITKSADYFIDEAAILGKHYGLSKMVIGLTIVAVGTSLPELFTSMLSILFTPNYSDFVVGTIMGSNISNVLLVFGMFLIFSKSFEIKRSEKLNISMLWFATLFFLIFVLLGFVNYFAIILVIAYTGYLVFLAKYRKSEILLEEHEIVDYKKESLTKTYLIFIGSFVGLYFGTKLVIFGIENMGRILEIPTAYLTLTVIASATSFPEIAVNIAAAKKKEYLLGIGNIVGSNIINIAFVFGLSGFFGFYTLESINYINSSVFLVLSTILFSILVLSKKFNSAMGWTFVLLYALYIISFFL